MSLYSSSSTPVAWSAPLVLANGGGAGLTVANCDLELNDWVVPPGKAVVLEGIDFAMDSIISNTFVATAYLSNAVGLVLPFFADAQTVAAGRAYASWRGSFTLGTTVGIHADINSTASGNLGIVMWGKLVSPAADPSLQMS